MLVGVRRTLLKRKAVVASGGALSFTYRDTGTITGTPAPSSTMFAAKAFGAASSDRIIICAIAWGGTNAAGMDIPSNGIALGGVTATQAAYSRPGSRAQAVYYALVTSGTTGNVGVTGYTNGFIDEIFIQLASVTGSAAASVASTYLTPTYPNGLTTSPSITVPSNGLAVISGITAANGATTVGSTWTGATVDHESWDGNNFGSGGTMAHLTASATVTETSVPGGGPSGWIAASFQP